MKIGLRVNGLDYTLETPPLRRLLDLLRTDLGLIGTKEGCGEGECGACAVLLNGRLVNSCLVPALQCDGATVTTIEGLGTASDPDPMQKAFLEEGAVQCGYCIPGMVLAARALLEDLPHPDEPTIRQALSGNLCRCTGYEKIVRAVQSAARRRAAVPRSGDVLTPDNSLGSNRARCASDASNRGQAPAPAAKSVTPPTRDLDAPERAVRAFIPRSLAEALQILRSEGDTITLIAGATDFMTQLNLLDLGLHDPVAVMDLSRLPELDRIDRDDGRIRIGSMVTVARLLKDPLVSASLSLLRQAAAVFGAPAIRNRATLGGNLLAASPAADLPPALLALDARLVLLGPNGRREVPLRSFYTGYRQTIRQTNELLVQVVVPEATGRQVFYKIGPRRAQSIAKVSLAGRLEADHEGRVLRCDLAAGSVGPTVVLLEETSRHLLGRILTAEMAVEAGRIAFSEVRPIDDVRSSAHYRSVVLSRLVTRFLREEGLK